MIRKSLWAITMVAVFAAGAAGAQKQKLYRWVDKEGKVHFDDALPPEAVNQARTEFNAKNGNTAGSVDRALTPEERAAQEAAARAGEAAAAKLGELKLQEDIMMASYHSESDLRRAYDERIGLLKTTLESTEISIKSLRENMATMLSQASDTELENRRVPEDRARTIRELNAERIKQQAFQVKRRVELETLTAEFARMLNRFRELKNGTAAPAPAALSSATPAPGATP